jgi:HAD superfamily phosphoserine phosphatase-like hydrolase
VIIFDFDKTLIEKDTLFGFYKIVHGNGIIFKIKRLVMLFSAVGYKLKLINNNSLKAIGIGLFLKGKTIEQLTQASIEYANQLKLNKIHRDVFLKIPKDKRIIISASPEIYLHQVFPDENILGTLLSFENNKVVGLKFNCYAEQKWERFKEKYPNIAIDEVYSDSMTDLPLFKNAKIAHFVTNENQVETLVSLN